MNSNMQTELKDAVENIPHNTDLDVTKIFNWVYGFAGIVAVGFIVYGAMLYVTAQGDSGKIKQASQTITFAVIGLIIVLVAAAITNYIAKAVVINA